MNVVVVVKLVPDLVEELAIDESGTALAAGTPLPDLRVSLNLPGVHNVQNALAAVAIGTEVGASDAAIVKAQHGTRAVGTSRFANMHFIAGEGRIVMQRHASQYRLW